MNLFSWFQTNLVRITANLSGLVADDPDEVYGEDPPETTEWQRFDGPLGVTLHDDSMGLYETINVPCGWPETLKVYGDPKVTYGAGGKVIVDRTWERENLMLAKNLGFGVSKLYVHRKMEPYLREGFRRAAVSLKADNIAWEPEKVGCFSPRHQRYNRNRPLSDHTLAIAIDVDPALNAPKTTNAKPFSTEWYQIWPQGVPRQFVHAMKSVGFDWGGYWTGWKDPMHFSLRYIR